MGDPRKATWTQLGCGFAGLLLVLINPAACSVSSSIADPEIAEATASSTQVTAALGSMAMEAALNQIDAGNFAALSGPPSVVATGNPTTGTVSLDFGTGTEVNNATVSGTVVGSYNVTGGTAVALTVTFSSLTAVTSSGGSAAITGSLTLAATLNGSSNISGTFTGSVTATVDGETTTVTPNLTYSIDGTPSTGDIALAGTVAIDSSVYGDWVATLTALTATISQSTRAINSGTLELDRSTFPAITATMTFTGQNTGTLDISPGGFQKAFTL